MTQTNNTAQAEIKVQPLSHNAIIAFFQKIWRWWLGVWYEFSDKHPKTAKLIYQVVFFFVFSMGVTIVQFLIMTFLPYAFVKLGSEPWGWPNIPLKIANGAPYILFGDTNGLGYFIAFEIAVFVAQCINFPLQRNITYKSKGNPYFQAMWYFIGWVFISLATNALWGLINAFLTGWEWYTTPGLDVVAGLIKTFITGGLSMAIFFPIFLIIFPDQKKEAVKAAAKVAKLKKRGADKQKVAAAQLKALVKAENAKLDWAHKEKSAAESLANAKALSWAAAVNKLKKMQQKGAKEAQILKQQSFIQQKRQEALLAAENRDAAINGQKAVITAVQQARLAREKGKAL